MSTEGAPAADNAAAINDGSQQQSDHGDDDDFPPQARARAVDTFRRFDADGDGTLTVSELHRALDEARLPTSRSRVEALFRAMDADGSGGVDEGEFVTFARRRRRALGAAFDYIASRGDGGEGKHGGGAERTAEAGAFTARNLRLASERAGVPLSDRDVREIMSAVGGRGANDDNNEEDAAVTFEQFLDCMMLVPHVNPHPFFDRWFVDSFSDDAASEFTVAREVRRDHEGQSLASAAAPRLVSGAAAGIISRTLTAPVDRIRLIMMTSDARIGVAEAYRRAVGAPSIGGGGLIGNSAQLRAMWMGNGTNCVKIAPEMAIKLVAFDHLKRRVAADPDNVTTAERFIAGGCAGALSEVSVYPLEVMRTRLATGGGMYSGFWDCARSVWRTAGIIGGFYAGVVPSVLGIIPYAAIDLTINSHLRDIAAERLQRRGREVSVPLLLGCGMVSSATATVATFPLNVLRTQAQATGRPLVRIVAGIRGEGVRGFYRGLVPCLIKVMPATSISYASYEWINSRHREYFDVSNNNKILDVT